MASLAELLAQYQGDTGEGGIKRGDAIFDGTDYPRTWDAFIGQDQAKEQMRIHAASAKGRGVRLDHTLLASGVAGLGKTTLATLLAYEAGVGLISCTGPMTSDDFRKAVRDARDNDIVMIDEGHLLVQGNRNRADWLLPFMTEGKLYTKTGVVEMPDVTIVLATTDAGKLPETLLSRFMLQPQLKPYTADEGSRIARNLAERMGVGVIESDLDFARVGAAADNNPRVMRQLLTAVRDLSYAHPDTVPNLELAMEWVGVSADGLSRTARDMLIALLLADSHTCSIDFLRAQLNEPGPLRFPEQQLIQRGLIGVTGKGRALTELGVIRARREATARKPVTA